MTVVLAIILVSTVWGLGAEAGLTEIQSWAPMGSLQFKTAAVCHFPGSSGYLDYYGVFAVFRVRSVLGPEVDQLWYLRVDGLSSYSRYGDIIDTQWIATEDVISHVDCTSDGNRTAYIAWDASDDALDTENAKWAQVDVYGTVGGIYEIPDCCSGASFAPGIAYHDGTVAVSGAGRGRCSYCSYVWEDADDPGEPAERSYWITEQQPRASDIAWNGVDYFIMTHLVYNDGSGRPFIAVTRLTEEGGYDGFEMLEEASWTDSNYNGIYLVYSDNYRNAGNMMLIQTDRRTYWIDRWGWAYDPPFAVGPFVDFPTCEYFGDEYRAAQTYSGFYWITKHQEWDTDAAPGQNVYYLWENNFGPVACASSYDYTDAEVCLVRKKTWTTVGTEYIYLDLQPQN